MIRRLLIALALASLALGSGGSNAHGEPARIAGYISAIDGRLADCLISRGKKLIPAQYWADLLVGDEVVAKGECRIEIMPRDGPRRWLVMESNSPAPMIERARRQAAMPKDLAPIGAALSQWTDALQPKPPPPAVIQRGKAKTVRSPVLKPAAPPPEPALAIPLLTGPGPQRLQIGPRRFNLAWIGGKPPFVVTLTGPGDAPPWVFEIGEERTVSSMIAPRPGVYDVRVVDAAGVVAHGRFQAIEAAPVIDQHDLAGLPQPISQILANIRLAHSEGGIWRLEAHARLADLGRDDYAAALMAARLRAGDPLPKAPDMDPAHPAIAASSGPGALGQ